MHRSRSLACFVALSTIALPVLAGCNGMTGAEGLDVEEVDQNIDGVGEPPPAAECVYPTSGFSNKPGGIMPDRKWQAFVDESMEASEISLSDYYDCDGSKGINALLVDMSATWCGSCQAEAGQINGELKHQWEAMGIEVLTLMIEDASSNPATADTALQWKKQFNLTTSTVGADPQFSFASVATGGSIGLPFLVVLDPRTMKLVTTWQGYVEDEGLLIELAQRNQVDY